MTCFILLCVINYNFITSKKEASSHLWMPEHSIQSRMPRLMLAQRGSAWPQSQQISFPGRHCTRCKILSPLTIRSRGSLAESILLVEGEAVLSRRWQTVQTVYYWYVCKIQNYVKCNLCNRVNGMACYSYIKLGIHYFWSFIWRGVLHCLIIIYTKLSCHVVRPTYKKKSRNDITERKPSWLCLKDSKPLIIIRYFYDKARLVQIV